MRHGGGMALLGLVCLGACQRTQGQVTVTPTTYQGWEGAWKLSNGTVEVVVVPQIGRIMRYGPVGGPNLLWENPDLRGKTSDPAKAATEWQNYGGDKLWPAPQDRWGWPPDPSFETMPHTAEKRPGNRLRLTSPVSAKHGVRFIREISLSARGTEVTLRNTMVNATQKPLEWSVWEVAQIHDPSEARMPLNPDGKFPKGYYLFGEGPVASTLTRESRQLRIRRHPEKPGKVGVDVPNGRLAADTQGWTIEIWATPQDSPHPYPDEGCSLEVYTNNDPAKYVELELLGPILPLAPGKSTTFTTHWRLRPTKH